MYSTAPEQLISLAGVSSALDTGEVAGRTWLSPPRTAVSASGVWRRS